jgi:hypothetical protein
MCAYKLDVTRVFFIEGATAFHRRVISPTMMSANPARISSQARVEVIRFSAISREESTTVAAPEPATHIGMPKKSRKRMHTCLPRHSPSQAEKNEVRALIALKVMPRSRGNEK